MSEPRMLSEQDKAMALADRVLDKPYIDPDGDICLLARQLLRQADALRAAQANLLLANTGGLSLLYDIRRALGWNDKTSLNILADGVRRIRRALETWDTPTDMDLETLAKAIKARVAELETINSENKSRIGELLEELDDARSTLAQRDA